MRDSDRFWWVFGLTSLGLFVAAMLAPWWFSRLIQQLAPVNGPDSGSGLDPIALFFGFFICLICLSVSMGVFGAVVVFTMAAQARRHHQKRVAALRGDLSVMPLATIQPDPDQAPDVSAQPLEVLWRMSDPIALRYRVLLVLESPMLLISAGSIPFILLTSLFASSMLAKPVSASEIAVTVTATGMFIALVVVAIRYLGRAVPTLFGRPFGVRATADGIEGHTEYGSRSFIAWDEVRLFEVIGPQGGAVRSFALYGQGKSVIWQDYVSGLGAGRAPYHATASENARRQAALLNLITARTGLEPRTLTRALQRV